MLTWDSVDNPLIYANSFVDVRPEDAPKFGLYTGSKEYEILPLTNFESDYAWAVEWPNDTPFTRRRGLIFTGNADELVEKMYAAQPQRALTALVVSTVAAVSLARYPENFSG